MAALLLIPSSKYSKGKVACTIHPNDIDFCYLWSNGGGRSINVEGREISRVVCTGCRNIKYKKVDWPAGASLKSLKIDLTNLRWIDDFLQYPHVCQPIHTSDVSGIRIRRDELKNAAEGRADNPEQSYKRINNNVREQFADAGEYRMYVIIVLFFSYYILS